MDGRFAQRSVLVIGGASGIGRAIAHRLASEGARATIADLNLDGARETAADVRGVALHVDVTDEASVRGAIEAASRTASGLSAVVCTAGFLPAASIEETTREEWDRAFAVNATGAFLVTKHAAPALRRGGGGAILLFSSTSGLSGAPGEAAYAAAKGAVIAFTRVAAVELASDGIRVNCVCPGWVDTPFNDPVWEHLGGREVAEAGEMEAIPMGRQGRPEEVAATAAFLLSDDASYISGVAYEIDGGASASG
jgi:dihydroanticapsin dehydrogenase